MRILIAEDVGVSRHLLETTLSKWGYDVVSASDGLAAIDLLQRDSAISLAILDWMMPGADGLEVCQQLRQNTADRMTYVILLTAKDSKTDIVEGLSAGADDYLTKPFDHEELRARIQVGERILGLQTELAGRVTQLERALTKVRRLQGLLPICCYCKKIRNDDNYWEQVEAYIGDHSEAEFSHGICPDCAETIVKPQVEELQRRLHRTR